MPLDKIRDAAGRHVIDNWRDILRRAWSIRLAVFWGAVSGVAAAWPALDEVVPTRLFVAGSVVFSVALVVARLTKQPGMDDV